MIRANPSPIEIIEVTDEAEIAAAREQRTQFDKNSQWLQAHASEVYGNHRGRYICIAGEELYVADTVREAVRQANAAHPEDKGWFTRYIPVEKVPRIYAF